MPTDLCLWLCIFSHQHMRHTTWFVRVCVCLCVCYHTSSYIHSLYVQSEAIYAVFCWLLQIHCVEFTENVLFARYGIICLPW